jgi:hypothetical protein
VLKTVLNKAATDSYATREGILRRARMLVPKLAARSEKAEQLRRCPDETIADFTEAGLLRVCQPKRYGGYDLGYDVLCEMVQTLAQGCGSQAWVAMVLADNPLKFSAFEISAQDEVWGANQEAKIAVAILPVVGRATPAQGGMRWSATHRFSSGIDHADWVICGGHVIRDGQPAEAVFALIQTSEVEIIDDWRVIGLAGSGTKSLQGQRRLRAGTSPAGQTTLRNLAVAGNAVLFVADFKTSTRRRFRCQLHGGCRWRRPGFSRKLSRLYGRALIERSISRHRRRGKIQRKRRDFRLEA